MPYYDYKAGKKRVKEILDNKLEVIEQDKIPKDENFTFDNAHYGWVTAIFVDIRDSSDIFSKEDKVEVSKMIRGFTSEIIEILRKDKNLKNDENLREIGIRGDCVYCIYTTPSQEAIYEIAIKSWYVNTYLSMLNKLLLEKGYSEIKVGIGVATSPELVIKAGKKSADINNKVWIGDAVTKASNLSGLGNKNGYNPIIYSELCYENFKDQMVKDLAEKSKDWFNRNSDSKNGVHYDAQIINPGFNNWIDDGMPD